MKMLLDTHALLWAISGDERLGPNARASFLNSENQLFFSIASLWEIGIKLSLGKLLLRERWLEIIRIEMKSNMIEWLSIEPTHCLVLSTLPFHHRDPFDRMLVAQAITESMHVASRDKRLAAYGINCVW
jgi:PIN domain nuclease of toxin-antitoxin system